ncbi:MAG: response regulator transcription factor [Pseudomonadales bacterium]|nr:response regulator transcription factor [Pseudomonadales bacterium]
MSPAAKTPTNPGSRASIIGYMDTQNDARKIWVVEDDERIAQLLQQFLQTEGFDVTWFANGEDAVAKIPNQQPDLIVLDLMLPGMNGVDVCLKIRPTYDNAILMLTAHQGDIQEVTALNAGVDDFLNKPIRTHVLLARINALLRRHGPDEPPSLLELHDLSIDHGKRQVHRKNRLIDITDSEFELLWILATNAGSVLKREVLFEQVRGIPYDGLDRSIDMRVSKLRKKLDENSPGIEYIRTLRQLGYLFLAE